MGQSILYCAGKTNACQIAAKILTENGLISSPIPGENVTDLLLDVPSFLSDGSPRFGDSFHTVLDVLPRQIHIWGGHLNSDLKTQYRSTDLLEDPGYLADNAAITGDCALKIAGPLLKTTWNRSSVLIVGWGRIGKWLARTLKGLGANVTVIARKAADRSLLNALNFNSATPDALPELIEKADIIFNTAPAPILNAAQLSKNPEIIAIDLASQKGLDGPSVIWARGLPGTHAPKASGALIAETILRLKREVK